MRLRTQPHTQQPTALPLIALQARPIGPAILIQHSWFYHAGRFAWGSWARVQPCTSADRAALLRPGRPSPTNTTHALARAGVRARVHADAQAGMLLPEGASAICVQRFDDSRTVQVTLRIAFRCVLHRCESQDIRC